MAKQSKKTKEVKKAIKKYYKAISLLSEIDSELIESIEVGGTIDDLHNDVHELEVELEESKEDEED